MHVTYEWHSVARTLCKGREQDASTVSAWSMYVTYKGITCVVYVTYEWHSVSRTLSRGRERDASTAYAWIMYVTCKGITCVWRMSNMNDTVFHDPSAEEESEVLAQHLREHPANLIACSGVCVAWLVYVCVMTCLRVWHGSFLYVPLVWLVHVCDMTRSCVWHDLFICVIWLIHMCDMTRSYVCHDSFICVTWVVHMCDMTRSYMWHD